MEINEFIADTLLNSDDIEELVQDKVYAIVAPQDTLLPLIVFDIENQERTKAQADNGNRWHSIAVTTWALTFKSAKEISDVVEELLKEVIEDDVICNYVSGGCVYEPEQNAFAYQKNFMVLTR